MKRLQYRIEQHNPSATNWQNRTLDLVVEDLNTHQKRVHKDIYWHERYLPRESDGKLYNFARLYQHHQLVATIPVGDGAKRLQLIDEALCKIS